MTNLHTPLCGLSITLIWQDSGLESLFSRLSILRALKIDKSNYTSRKFVGDLTRICILHRTRTLRSLEGLGQRNEVKNFFASRLIIPKADLERFIVESMTSSSTNESLGMYVRGGDFEAEFITYSRKTDEDSG